MLHGNSPLRYYTTVLLFLFVVVTGVGFVFHRSLTNPLQGSASTSLNGRPLSTINFLYSSARPVVGTLVEMGDVDQRLVLELDSSAMFHVRGSGKDAFELTQPLDAGALQGDPVTWSISIQGAQMSVQIQSIQLQATPLQSVRLTLPSGWSGFAPTQAVTGPALSAVEGVTTRVNGSIVSAGTLPALPAPTPSATQNSSKSSQPSSPAPGPTHAVGYSIGPVRHFTTLVVAKTDAPSTVNTTVDGVVRLQWDRYVDPAHVSAGSDIGFQIERSQDDGPFSRITVAVAGEPQNQSTVEGTVSTVFDPLDLSTVRGKKLRYSIRTVGAREQSELAMSQPLSIKVVDLESESPRLSGPAIVNGCARFSYRITNRGDTSLISQDKDRFMIVMQVDEYSAGTVRNAFSTGIGIVKDGGSVVSGSPKTLVPGASIEQEEIVCIPQATGWQQKEYVVSILADRTQPSYQRNVPSYFMRGILYSENMLQEENEANNVASLRVAVAPCREGWCMVDPSQRPDLTVEEIQFRKQTLKTVEVLFTVANRGAVAVPIDTMVEAQYFVDGTLKATQEFRINRELNGGDDHSAEILLGGRNIIAYATGPFPSPPHTVEVRIDTKNVVNERNEANNSRKTAIPPASTMAQCNSTSVDLLTSSEHCSACSERCAPDQECRQGVCQVGTIDLEARNFLYTNGSSVFSIDMGISGSLPTTPTTIQLKVDIDGTIQTRPSTLPTPIFGVQTYLHRQNFNLPQEFRPNDPHRIEIELDALDQLKERDESNNRWVERFGPQNLLVRLALDGQQLSFVDTLPIIANKSATLVGREGMAYRAELIHTTASDAAEQSVETFFSAPIDQRIRLVNNQLVSETIGGEKPFTIAFPYTGTAKRLKVWEVDGSDALIDVSFDAQGNVLSAQASSSSASAPGIMQKAIGFGRTQWEKTQKRIKSSMCWAFGWNSRLNQLFGCSQ